MSTEEKLVMDLRHLARKWGAAEGPQYGRLAVADEAASAISRLSAEVQELREALRPFAVFADALNEKVPDNTALGIYADGAMRFGPSGEASNVGALRRARAALKPETGK